MCMNACFMEGKGIKSCRNDFALSLICQDRDFQPESRLLLSISTDFSALPLWEGQCGAVSTHRERESCLCHHSPGPEVACAGSFLHSTWQHRTHWNVCGLCLTYQRENEILLSPAWVRTGIFRSSDLRVACPSHSAMLLHLT
jgi:hypothetical protein